MKDNGAILMIGMEKPNRPGMDVPVPTHTLEVDGTAPAEGDSVEFTVKGTVTRIAGGKTFVKPTEINGEPIGMPEEKPEDMADDDVMSAAKKADDNSKSMVP